MAVPVTGRAVTTQECAFYRVEEGKIVEVWLVAHNLRVLGQLAGNVAAPAAAG